jgi:phosphate-selective porin OprO and OprP
MYSWLCPAFSIFLAFACAAPLPAAEAPASAEPADLSARVSALEKKLQETNPSDLRLYWKDGPKMESADKQFKFELGGRVFTDIVWIGESAPIRNQYGQQQDGAELRAAWLSLSGELYERVTFKFEYDFAPAAGAAKDIYLGIRNLPCIGNVQAGHFREFFDLEELTSSRFVTFMEKNLCNAAFSPARNVGLGAFDAIFDKRMTWAAGVFKDVDDKMTGLSDGDAYAVTGRVTGLPWYERDGKELVHIGLGASSRSPGDNTVQFRARPETHVGSYLVDTGALFATHDYLVDPELAAVCGPFSVQAQYYLAHITSHVTGSPTFGGWYVCGSFFVTGESRPYKSSTGVFDRVRPAANFLGSEGGRGAIELTVRYSHLDLNDNAIYGGIESDITGGVNWYLNPNMRIMLNYVYANVKDVGAATFDGKESLLLMRFQFDW